MADATQAEANLQGQFSDNVHFRKINIAKT